MSRADGQWRRRAALIAISAGVPLLAVAGGARDFKRAAQQFALPPQQMADRLMKMQRDRSRPPAGGGGQTSSLLLFG
jgi:hypothetical protein